MPAASDDFFSHPPAAEPAWQEAVYFNIHDDTGEFSAICGLDLFPNGGQAVAWLQVRVGDEHRTCFQAGPPVPSGGRFAVGELAYEILEPQRRWRLDLRDPAADIEGPLEFVAAQAPYRFQPIRCSHQGQLAFDQCYYNQGGAYLGELRVGGRRFGNLRGLRARRWGMLNVQAMPFYNWLSIPLPSRTIVAWQFEDSDGQVLYCDGASVPTAGEPTPVVRLDHEWVLVPDGRHPARADFKLTLASGEVLAISGEELASHYLGALPMAWSNGDAGMRALAEVTANSIESRARFHLGAESGIGFYDVASKAGYRRYGLDPAKA